MAQPNARRRRADEAAKATRLFPVEGGHSPKDEWGTPPHVFDPLDEEFAFTLDVCAEAYNAKCEDFYSPTDDGLRQPWHGRVWCNPPYSQTAHWVEKAWSEVTRRHGPSVVVLLLPVWADQDWWHDYIVSKPVELRWVRGRIKFLGPPRHRGKRPMFASVIAIMGRLT